MTRELEQAFGVLMRRLRTTMAQRAQMLHPDLNANSYSILLNLQQRPARASEVAEFLELDKGAVSRMVRHLEELGFIERKGDPDDGRARKLSLTADALRRLEEVASERRDAFQQRIQEWSVDDLRQLVTSIKRYNDALA